MQRAAKECVRRAVNGYASRARGRLVCSFYDDRQVRPTPGLTVGTTGVVPAGHVLRHVPTYRNLELWHCVLRRDATHARGHGCDPKSFRLVDKKYSVVQGMVKIQ